MNNAMDFFSSYLFSYWKYFSIILSLFSYLLGENKLLPFSMKSINPIQSIHMLLNQLLVFHKYLL